MSRYALRPYWSSSAPSADATYYGPDVVSDVTYAASLSAIPINYSTIRLSWSKPLGSWSRFILVRNPYGYPLDIDDGIIIEESSTGTPQAFIDTEIAEGREYYYSIFVQDTINGTWHLSAGARSISVKDFNTYENMWAGVPVALRSASRTIVDDSDENQDLSDFIRLLAFEYDLEKTQAYLLRYVYDSNRTPQNLLPALLDELGLDYEPNISDKQLRVLIRNAVKVYQSKGSIAGLKEFIKAFSNYDTVINKGKNLMLTYNDSSFEESVGSWVATGANIAVVGTSTITPYIEPTSPALFPNRRLGSLKITATSAGTVSLVCGGATPSLTGIPVSASTAYVFSAYTRAASTARNVTLAVKWYKSNGVLISTSTGTAALNSTSAWTRRTVSVNSPALAAFAVLTVSIASVSNTEIHYMDALQFEAGLSVTAFEDARTVGIVMRPTRINELLNPNFTSSYSHWSAGNSSRIEIVGTSGTNPHVGVGGSALEVYPSGTGNVIITSDAITTVIPNEYYTFSAYGTVGSYNGPFTTTDLVRTSVQWLNSSNAVIGESDGAYLGIIRKPSSDWRTTSYILPLDYIGIETDTLKFKVGDGSTPWNLLTYASSSLTYKYKKKADWLTTDFIDKGVIGVETDTLNFKIGNGTATWGSLSYTTTIPAWVRPSITSRSPANTAKAVVRFTWVPSSIYMAVVIDEALFEKSTIPGAFFDGAMGSVDLAGLMWEGTANNSRSYYYRNYTATTSRLIELVPEYLMTGSTFKFTYSAV